MINTTGIIWFIIFIAIAIIFVVSHIMWLIIPMMLSMIICIITMNIHYARNSKSYSDWYVIGNTIFMINIPMFIISLIVIPDSIRYIHIVVIIIGIIFILIGYFKNEKSN